MKKMNEFEKGDKVILLSSRQGNILNPEWYNTPLEIISHNPSSGYYQVKIEGKASGTASIYYKGGNQDEFCEATRQAQAEYLKNQINIMKEKIKRHREEVNRLLEFDSEEEYTASKLSEIMTAHENNDPKKMAEILKLMKKQNYL